VHVNSTPVDQAVKRDSVKKSMLEEPLESWHSHIMQLILTRTVSQTSVGPREDAKSIANGGHRRGSVPLWFMPPTGFEPVLRT
jgi:hypothetical protein